MKIHTPIEGPFQVDKKLDVFKNVQTQKEIYIGQKKTKSFMRNLFKLHEIIH